MDHENKECCVEKIVIKGYVHYKDNKPVNGAIIILEMINYGDSNNKCEDQEKVIYLNHTVTNCYGEFCFYISDRTRYYRIKVFDNHHS